MLLSVYVYMCIDPLPYVITTNFALATSAGTDLEARRTSPVVLGLALCHVSFDVPVPLETLQTELLPTPAASDPR